MTINSGMTNRGGLSGVTLVVGVALVLCLLLSGCTDKLKDRFDPEKHDFIDRSNQLNRDDYRRMGHPDRKKDSSGKFVTKVEKKAPPIPSLAQVLSAPRPPKLGETQLVSIAVTDDVPLKDVLLELARLAEVDVELDAGITGGVSFTAKDKPFNEVIERLAALAGLRYSMKGGVLRVERDVPYIKSYSLDFLNIVRGNESTVNVSTNVLSATGGGKSGLNTGSTSTITSTTESDFWAALESGIKEILSYKATSRVSPQQQIAAFPGEAGVAGEQPTGAANAGSSPSSTGVGDGSKTFYILNRQAGMLTVSANDKQQELVRLFIDKIRRNASAQVLIEAKIVEVSLNDEYESGIEWSALNSKFGLTVDFSSLDGSLGNVATFDLPSRIIDGLGGDIDGSGPDLNDFLNLMGVFGTARTLSSPRLHAINNQQAVLTFAENLVYFEIKVDRETDTSSGVNQQLLTVDSQVKTVPIGIILTLQPSINLETNEITLSVRPTLSRVTGKVSDPAVAFLASQGGVNIVNEIPVVEVRELDSILKLKSGQVMVIGGLMEQKSANTDTGMPFVSEVPWLGNLFKSAKKDDEISELVIFIRATIVGSDNTYAPADRYLYEKFTDDPRPLAF